MKNKEKRKWTPSVQILMRYMTIAVFSAILLMFYIPRMLDFPPEVLNVESDIKITGVTYMTEIAVVGAFILGLTAVIIKKSLRDIDKWYISRNATKAEVKKIRLQCMTLPYIFFAIEMILTVGLPLLFLAVVANKYPMLILKTGIIMFIFSLLAALATFVFCKDLFDKFLADTYTDGVSLKINVSFKQRYMLLMLGIILSVVVFTSFISYISVIEEKNIALFNIYKEELNELYDKEKIYEFDEILEKVKELPNVGDVKSKYVLDEDGNTYLIDKKYLSKFVINYTINISEKYDGKIYYDYGVDVQGASIKVKTAEKDFYVCVLYESYTENTVTYLIVNSMILIILMIIVINVLVNSIVRTIDDVTLGLESVANNKSKKNIIPVTVNDEVGDIVQAFNKIQKQNQNRVETINDNQNSLIERERLALLGQMVGGIAHNLKTPIFSIAGGLEGLNDLIKEYKESIEDPNVTDEDMHEIAKDMNEWIGKLKGHVSYMSDVITAVKGQAVNLSDNNVVQFTIEEVFNRTEVLMQHDIKASLSELKISNKVPNSIKFRGGINNLVQVLSNLILNAIQAYGDTDKRKIVKLEATYEKPNNLVIISIKDNGPGIPKEVQEKMFKEMITTKGKNGTGIGLFMSKSNIKGHFKGDITYKTKEGKGTTFFIKLPVTEK